MIYKGTSRTEIISSSFNYETEDLEFHLQAKFPWRYLQRVCKVYVVIHHHRVYNIFVILHQWSQIFLLSHCLLLDFSALFSSVFTSSVSVSVIFSSNSTHFLTGAGLLHSLMVHNSFALMALFKDGKIYYCLLQLYTSSKLLIVF